MTLNGGNFLTYVVSLHYTLGNTIRRMNMVAFFLTSASILLPAGLVFVTLGDTKNNTIMIESGGWLIGISLIILFGSYFLVIREQNERSLQREQETERFNATMLRFDSLINQIKQDRNGKHASGDTNGQSNT